MCGIFGYIGNKKAVPFLINGLKKLEYRGYDSAGVCLSSGQKLEIYKDKGKVSEWEEKVALKNLQGNIGIGHTRWATHGEPCKLNAHPHWDCTETIAIVHNGIIENYQTLKSVLEKEGHKIVSETDSEIIAHLIEKFYSSNLEKAVMKALKLLEGTFGLAIIHNKEPKLIAAKRGSPLIIGISRNEMFVASDAAAVLSHTKKVVYLEDNEVAIITRDNFSVKNLDGGKIEKEIEELKWNVSQLEKRGFKHFMLKEIFEQPEAIKNTLRGRISACGRTAKDDKINPVGEFRKDFSKEKSNLQSPVVKFGLASPRRGNLAAFGNLMLCFAKHLSNFSYRASQMNICPNSTTGQSNSKFLYGVKLSVEVAPGSVKRIVLIACGTSWHSCLIGKYIIEGLARMPVTVETASEFRYRNPIVSPQDLVVAVSQSGETADTIGALKWVQSKGIRTLGIVNVVGSTIARMVDSGIFLHAGPEIGVASTKAFTCQLTALILLALYLQSACEPAGEILAELTNIPSKIKSILEEADKIKEIAERLKDSKDFLYLGRGVNFPVALEGALKLKEISYIHAEGYAAGEMKHGPIALIDKNMPVVFLATQDHTYEKILSNMEEVKARKGRIIAVTDRSDKEINRVADYIIKVPETIDILSPIINVIPLQLLAYYVADLKNINPDRPRHLAKAVTVE